MSERGSLSEPRLNIGRHGAAMTGLRWVGEGPRRGLDSQIAQRLEASEGSLCDVADGVVAQPQSVQVSQHRQDAFVQTSQVVVGQISGGERERQCV